MQPSGDWTLVEPSGMNPYYEIPIGPQEPGNGNRYRLILENHGDDHWEYGLLQRGPLLWDTRDTERLYRNGKFRAKTLETAQRLAVARLPKGSA